MSAVAVRGLGMGFRVFLSMKMGADGLGLYQLILSVQLLFAAVASSGISLCSTRLFSEFSARGCPAKAHYSIQKCMRVGFLMGCALCALLMLLSGPAAGWVIRDARAAPALRLLAPGLPLISVSAAVRGYFFSIRKILPNIAEQFLQQLSEIGAVILLFRLFPPADIGEACCLTCLGSTFSAGVSFVYCLFCYRSHKGRASSKPIKGRGINTKMLSIMLPVSANALLRFGLSAAENALIPAGLQRYGMSAESALSEYGIISGMVMPVLVFPCVAVLPFASLIIPEIAEAKASGQYAGIRRMTERLVGAVLRYSLPVMTVMMFFGGPLCDMMFHSKKAGDLLVMLAPVVPFMYLDCVVDAILKGMNEQTSYFIFNTIDSVLRVLLTVLLLPALGINGAVTVIIISELLNTVMSLWRLIRVSSFRLSIMGDILLPLAAITVPCLFLRLLPESGGAGTVLRIALCTGFYGGSLLLYKRLNDHDTCGKTIRLTDNTKNLRSAN